MPEWTETRNPEYGGPVGSPPAAGRAGSARRRSGAAPKAWWRLDVRDGAPLLVLGAIVIAIGIYAFLANARVGASHFPIWLYLVCLGGVALVGGVGTAIVGEPLEDLPVAGDHVGDDLIVVPASEWEALRVLARERLRTADTRFSIEPSAPAPPPVDPVPAPVVAEVLRPRPAALASPALPPRTTSEPPIQPPSPVARRGPATETPTRVASPASSPDWMTPKMPARAGPAPPSPRATGTAALTPGPRAPAPATPPGATTPPLAPKARRLAPGAPRPAPKTTREAPPESVGRAKRRPGTHAQDTSTEPSTSPTDGVGDLIDILESALPAEPVRPASRPAESEESGPVNCRHCSVPIPANKPWLRCESCDGGLCLDGLVEAAEAGQPGICPACRSLFGELTSE